MRLLLDTHTLIWFAQGNAALSSPARDIIADTKNQRLVSVASLWEMAIKYSSGKLNLGAALERCIPQVLGANDIQILDILLPHIYTLSGLPMHHKDPFDRMLAAQSLAEGIPVVGRDDMLDLYGVDRRW